MPCYGLSPFNNLAGAILLALLLSRLRGSEWEQKLMDLIRIILAIFLPPVAVFLKVGLALHFWINLLLTILGFVPGVIHAIWVLVKK